MDKIVQIMIDGKVTDHWQVSKEQWAILDILQKFDMLKEDIRLKELTITKMN